MASESNDSPQKEPGEALAPKVILISSESTEASGSTPAKKEEVILITEPAASGEKKEGEKGKEDPQKKPPSPFKRKVTALVKNRTFQIIAAIVVLIVLILLFHHAMTHESTDDAYTSGHIHNISARIADTVLEVRVDDNERVKEGQILVVLDPADYQVRVDQAKANYEKALADFKRLEPLKGDEAISQQDYDTTTNALDVAKAQYEDAKNQLAYCIIRAPADGRIGRKSVEPGNRVTIGGALMAVVEDAWVIGNFKETQLAKMCVGQRATVKIDAIAGKKFVAYVDSFSPGTGSTFALLPPDNATGNFTKVVQRVPVKLRFDPDSIRGYEDRIVPGLSCEPEVDLSSGGEKNRFSPLHPQMESTLPDSIR